MDDWIEDRLSEEDCERLFASLFPQGFGGADVLRELAPGGWEASPWIAVFHPSVDRMYEEALQLHRNLERLPFGKPREPTPPPTLEQIRAGYEPKPVQPTAECQELVCRCLWHVFSDNHEVINAERKVADIGSWRGAAGFLADLLNRETGRQEHDYMDFYMGLIWLDGRADVTDVYAMIFRRLKERLFDWIFHFPRLYLADLSGLREELDEDKPELDYDPSESFARQQEKQKHEDEVAQMRQEMDDAHQEALEQARQAPPPEIVVAYQRVYGHSPEGWPP